MSGGIMAVIFVISIIGVIAGVINMSHQWENVKEANNECFDAKDRAIQAFQEAGDPVPYSVKHACENSWTGDTR